MTEAQQRRFYFPAWNGCAVANKWLMVRGRLQADLAEQALDYAGWPDPAQKLYLKVVLMAEQLALQAHRAVIAEDLRHACNYVATGKLSSSALDNKQTNRVVALFNLLRDPEDLDAVMNWLNPENAERGSFVAFLRKQAHEGVLIAISKRVYGTRQWEDLPIEKLRWLARELKNPAIRTSNIKRREPVTSDDPF